MSARWRPYPERAAWDTLPQGAMVEKVTLTWAIVNAAKGFRSQGFVKKSRAASDAPGMPVAGAAATARDVSGDAPVCRRPGPGNRDTPTQPR